MPKIDLLRYFLERLDNLDIILRGSQVIVHDPVAQVDRVSVSEAGGHEFDSHRDHQHAMRKWRNW